MSKTLNEYANLIKVDKCAHCWSDWSKTLTGESIDFYDHEWGWPVTGFSKLQWLSYKCPNCGDDISLNKMGVSRSIGDEEKQTQSKSI